MPHSKGFGRRKEERSPQAAAIGKVVEELLAREPSFARGRAIGRLAAEWASVVGPRLATESAPVSLDGGILVVAATTGPWGAQVRFLADRIRERANATLGAAAVNRVNVIVRGDPRKGL